MITLEQLTFNLIRTFEGLKLAAYQDSVKVWTVGYGHTKDVTRTTVITLAEAYQFFEEDIQPLAVLVKDRPMLEAASLISFGYNCGEAALKLLLTEPIEHLLLYNKAGNAVLTSLDTRRKLEYSLIVVSRGNA